MTPDDSLEAFWRFLKVVDHGEFYIAISDNIGVGFVFLLSLNCSLLVLEAWLVEIDLLCHDDRLNGDQNLKKSGYL